MSTVLHALPGTSNLGLCGVLLRPMTTGGRTTTRTPLGGTSASAGHRPGVIGAFPGCAGVSMKPPELPGSADVAC